MSESATEPRDERDAEGTPAVEPRDEAAEKTAELEAEKTDGPDAESDAAATAELDNPPAGNGDTVRRPPVEATAPRPASGSPADPRLRDVTRTVSGYVRGRLSVLAGLVRRHRAASVVLALIGMAVMGLLAVALVRAATLPSSATIDAAARELFSAPEYSGGTYGTGGALVTREVDVRSVRRSATTPEGMGAAFGASGYAVAEVVITYAGQSVSADRGATIGFALVDGEWTAMSGARDNGLAWRATSGVDQERALLNLDLALSRADLEAPGVEPSLSDLYAGAAASVASESFDENAQTDTLVIACSSDGTFYSYACQLTVTYAFSQGNGTWSLSGVEVSEGARERNLDGLLGTWSGTFQSQETDGSKCLAARKAGLTIEVTSAAGSEISGTVSGVAHYHVHPAHDAQDCEGDLVFENEAFVATLVEGEDAGDAELTFAATLPEDVDGTVTLTLAFGAGGETSRVTAHVTTSYAHDTAFLFVPYEETLTYTDLFALTRGE